MSATIAMAALAVACVVATTVLVAVEQAFGAVSRAHVSDLAVSGRRGAPSLARMLADRARYVNVLLFARITTSTFAVVVVTVLCVATIGSPGWAAPVVAGLVMLIVGYVGFGVAATTIGQQHADSVALKGRVLARLCYLLFGWLATVMIIAGNAVTPGRGYRQGPFVTQSELRELVDLAEADHVIEADERQMIHSVFELGGTIARNVMVPRTEMVWIEQHKRLRQAISLALRSGYSRVPVVGENLDDVVGVLYLKDLVRRTFENGEAAASERVETLMRAVMYVPDSKPVDDLLREMQAARVHMAVVVDEYGGTAGLVTIEDIIEEIVGEITDEYDQGETPEVVDVGPGRWRVDSKMALDDFAELTGVDVSADSESVETVAGLLARRLGVVPIPGSAAAIQGYELLAEAGSGRRNQVATVLVSRVGSGDSRQLDGA